MIQSRFLSSCNRFKTFDFSTLYTTIPHSKLKDRLRELVQLCFIKKNVQLRYKYLVLGRDRSYFVKKSTLWFYQQVLWNWYHQHSGVFDWQHICYLWWTCFSTDSPFLADLFLNSYEADLIQGFLKKNEKKLAWSFNFTFRYILVDDVLSLNNSRFGDFVDRTYPIELEIKNTTDTDRSASYLDLHLEIDSEGWLRTKLYDKRDDFNFPIVISYSYSTTCLFLTWSTGGEGDIPYYLWGI